MSVDFQWPPPPRPTPIIVPSHLTSSSSPSSQVPIPAYPSTSSPISSDPGKVVSGGMEPSSSKGKGKQGRQLKSSLHRAVMEKLEVQKAMNDLAGIGEPG